ncbi:biotin synthase BioB [Chitinivibrio alkaliphilus]|uniref:Biotin synthase n=1 Tax=Chitinivibrio alkaliphilus ACht1 TaxID=1313304 RepID=U7D680_9BACT|nr:biotin synthase BioB [Chitinivibrio alkaliphilus]ERP31081.1 biotin synthase [Chitinivibrio alkaliphilus ACht1]
MTQGISVAEAREYMQLPHGQVFDLISQARRVREEYLGCEVSLCSIVNAKSGNCREDCSFCPQSVHAEASVETYPLMDKKDILAAAKRAELQNAHNMGIVTSGRKISPREMEDVQRAVEMVGKETSLGACASLGLVDTFFMEELKAAGLQAIHHNLESSRSFYEQICTTRTYDENLRVLHHAKDAGLRVCSGGLFGLGESNDQRVELFDELRRVEVDSVPINFLHPREGTRAASSAKKITPLAGLKIIAVARLMMPRTQIRIAGGREYTLRDMQSWIFAAGANALMVGNYLTTAGRSIEDDLQMIADAGMIVSETGGCGA